MILKSSPPRTAPLMGGFSNDAPEPATEMRLIAHAAAQGNGTERVTRRQHQALSHFDAPAHEIVVCRESARGLECPAEVADAEAEQRREVFASNSASEMRVDVRHHPPLLPGRKATAHSPLHAALRRTRSRWYRARFSAKQGNRLCDVGLCGLAVTVPSKACSIDESRGDRGEAARKICAGSSRRSLRFGAPSKATNRVRQLPESPELFATIELAATSHAANVRFAPSISEPPLLGVGRKSPLDPSQAVGKWLKRHMHLVFSLAGIDFRAGSSRLDVLGGVADCCNGVGLDVSGIAVDCCRFV
jgi:hypothetical protein